ncbi:MAG: histidinol phosphate phosphatase [Acidimicrobiia bacterium]|nr:histidinol phosphate phosphatase [Acidimicrobiia bacterium]
MSAAPVDAELVASATELAERAGQVTLRWFSPRVLASGTKADGSPVTEADRAAEDFLRAELARRYPDDAVVGEEYGDSSGASGRRWVIDPIDGTRSFVRGVPLFATLLALIDESGPAVGVAHVPALHETVAAGRGRGALHDCGGERRPARVSEVRRLDEACLVTSGIEYLPERGRRALMQPGPLVRTWGDGYGYVLVATGRAEIMLDAGLALWDVAPMLVIIPEAGGRITDYDGEPGPQEGDVVASNGHMHQPALGLLGSSV